jgi:hypothetical protein
MKLSALSCVLALSLPLSANAIEMDLTCPASVQVGKPLKVVAKFSNDSCSNYTINRYMAGLAGNGNNALQMHGPKMVDTGGWIVPPATKLFPPKCYPNKPGTLQKTITVLNPVPATLGGNVSVALVQLLTTRNQTISGKTCLVNIVP